MKSRIVTLILLTVVLILSGCALKEYRAQKIYVQHPNWDEDTVQQVAARRVKIGMTEEMVVAALGKPDAISREGDQLRWGYATLETYGQGNVYYKFVYFVYFKTGQVIRTEGDWSKLGYTPWYR